MKPKVLVFLGTSRQGAAVVDALLASDKFEVYATTRSAKSAEALKARGVKCGPFTCGDAASAKAALDAAEPSLVFFTTLMGSREVEGSAGKIIVDAIKAKGGVQHVVYSSVANADVAPDAVGHFKSKLDVEDHLKASGLNYSILRPVAFFENYDDPANFNALEKGLREGPLAGRPEGEARRVPRHRQSRRGHAGESVQVAGQNPRLRERRFDGQRRRRGAHGGLRRRVHVRGRRAEVRHALLHEGPECDDRVLRDDGLRLGHRRVQGRRPRRPGLQGVVRSQGREVLVRGGVVVLVLSGLFAGRGDGRVRRGVSRSETPYPPSRLAWGLSRENSETKYVSRRVGAAAGSSRPAVARTQFEMATEHSGQTGVVTVASSHGLRHCPWKRCAQGMSCVSTRPRRQKGHRAL